MASPYALTIRNDTGAGGSTERGAAELANANAAHGLSNIKTSGAIAAATVTSKVQFASTLAFSVGGTWYSANATDNFWVLGAAGANTTVAASSWQKYALCIDTGGLAVVFEGTQSTIGASSVTWKNVANTSIWSPLLTILNTSPGLCIAGVLTVATDATHTFVPGTTLLGAAGITASYINGVDASLLPLISNQAGTLIYGNGG